MKSIILNNGVKLIYKKTESSLTSFCIGFNAGADKENNDSIGVAHAVEHMVFKGTDSRSEEEINKKCDELFAFNNAMTNFPYVIYYGVCSNEDFEEGFELYSDIVINPKMNFAFEEEMSVIRTESREWKEDIDQYCEDELYYNAFKSRRMKKIIIGDKEDIEKITQESLIKFYNKYYVGSNCTVSVVTSLDFDDVKKISERTIGIMKRGNQEEYEYNYELGNSQCFNKSIEGFTGAKIQYCFDISDLNDDEIEAMRIFNAYFGEGVSCVLYDNLRTKHGYVYDVSSEVKNESGIKLFTIKASTSKDKINDVKALIDNIIKDVQCGNISINNDDIKNLYKRIIRKRNMDVERGIIMAVRLTTYNIMYGNEQKLVNELEGRYDIISNLNDIVKHVFRKSAVQIIR